VVVILQVAVEVVVIFPEQLDLVVKVEVLLAIHIHHLLVEQVLEHTPLVVEEEELEELMEVRLLVEETVVQVSL
jgi:hypothetical protein